MVECIVVGIRRETIQMGGWIRPYFFGPYFPIVKDCVLSM
jgi:hypothetical protein